MIPTLALLLLALDCHTVDGDRILGRDLAAASPALESIAPDAVIANAPLPGARRIFSPAEIGAIAHARQIEAERFDSICIERATAPLDPAKVVEAMRKSLALPDLAVEIVELSRFPVAAGEVVFPRDNLPPAGTSGSGIWKGYVSYSGGHQSVWANVILSTAVRRVVAAVDLSAGSVVTASDLRFEELRDFPTRTAPLTDMADAVGKAARRPIRVGAPLLAGDLVEPNCVERGQTVTVEVRSGAAVLVLDAVAESAGHRGETIAVRNSASGKVFRAQVREKGRLSLEIPTEAEGSK
jgi:flagella basal body P-ring formation protein FlgA